MKKQSSGMNYPTRTLKRVLLALVVLLVASAALVGAGSAADAGTDVVAKIGDKDYTSLADALEDAKTSNNGAVIVLQKDLTLDHWIAVAMSSVSFTLDGNHHTISGLSQPLFEYIGWNGVTVTIKNLTIDNPQITTYSGPNVGSSAALASYVGVSQRVTLSNCNVNGGLVSSESFAGGLVGYAEQGPLEIVDCSVNGMTVTTTTGGQDIAATGAMVGYSNGIISVSGSVGGNIINSADGSGWQGSVIGVLSSSSGNTINVEETSPSTSNNDLYVIGGLLTDATYTGGSYYTDPILEGGNLYDTDSTTVGTAASGYIFAEKDGKWILKVAYPVAEISGTGYLTLKDAINDATNGDTVKLLKDTTETGIIVPSGKEITIDLNGNTLTGDILSNGILTIKNGIIISNTFTSAIESYGDSAKLTVEKLTATSQRQALRIEGGKATIISGTYTTVGRVGEEDSVYALNAGGAFVTTVLIKDGTFNGLKYNNKAENPDSSAAVYAQNNAVVTIEGGTFGYGQNDVLLTSGTGSITVYGGTYDQDPSNYVAADYRAVLNGQNWIVELIPRVAEVNGIQYIDLQTAIDNANDGDTVKLLENIELEAKNGVSGTLTPLINISTDITLDMSGKKINLTQPSSSVVGMPLILNITDGAKVTITGNGIIDAECGDNAVYGMRILDGTVIIESGSFTGAATVAQVTKGELIINGGSFDMAETYKSTYSQYYKYLLNCIDANYKDGSAKITIKGGKFTGFNPANNEAEGTGTNFVAEGYEVAENGNEYTVSKIQPASKPSSSGSSGSSVWLTETPTPTPTPSVTPTETETVPTDIPSTQPTDVESPGFGVLVALAGLGAVAVLRRR